MTEVYKSLHQFFDCRDAEIKQRWRLYEYTQHYFIKDRCRMKALQTEAERAACGEAVKRFYPPYRTCYDVISL